MRCFWKAVMKINIAKSSGFCFGVRRAIDISLSLAGNKKPVYILGDIVHNTHVVDRLSQKGIKKIKRIRPVKDAVLIISAHGASARVFKRAKECGYRIVDATCPKVRDIYKIARRLEKKNRVIIIGDRGHAEVMGIAGQLKKKPITVESADRIPVKQLARVKKAAVITQSTQSLHNISSIMGRLEKIIPLIKLYNTTCRITAAKQKEIEVLSQGNDAVLIIGSSTSANTKRLYQISREINTKTYWIESAKDLKPAWVKNAGKVGIMAGASTPDEIVADIVTVLNIMVG